MELLKSENLIELHEKLNEFATHHYNKGANKGANEVYRFIKKVIEDRASEPSVGTEEGQLIERGYTRALHDILSKLQAPITHTP